MRRAFVTGWDGPPEARLQHAEHDANRISEFLGKPPFDFEVQLLRPTASAVEFRHDLFNLTETATSEDVLIVFAACHGVVDQELLLLPNSFDDDRPLSTGVLVSDVMHALARSRSLNKLLMLDCCNAASALPKMGSRRADEELEAVTGKPENFLLFAASNRFESAREFEDLNGGFFTDSFIKSAGQVTVQYDKDPLRRLERELQEQATAFNRRRKLRRRDSVPYPRLLGEGKLSFPLCSPGLIRYPRIELPIGMCLIKLPWDGAENESPRYAVTISADGPKKQSSEGVWSISELPVTNRLYRIFVEESGHPAPVGEAWSGESWEGPFFPWEHEHFGHDDLPVVCVTYDDAYAFARWASRICGLEIRLPPVGLWEFAAFGPNPPNLRSPKTWLTVQESIHHRANGPTAVTSSELRRTRSGAYRPDRQRLGVVF